jgi:hypothetical protein
MYIGRIVKQGEKERKEGRECERKGRVESNLTHLWYRSAVNILKCVQKILSFYLNVLFTNWTSLKQEE